MLRFGSRVCSVAALLLLTLGAGCAQFQEVKQDMLASSRNRHLANVAWASLRDQYGGRPYLEHFERGFLQGYFDVAQGGDGCVPAFPPERYWSVYYQSAEGEQMIQTWFEGYTEGARVAEMDGVRAYSLIPTTIRTEQDAGPPVLVEPGMPAPLPLEGYGRRRAAPKTLAAQTKAKSKPTTQAASTPGTAKAELSSVSAPARSQAMPLPSTAVPPTALQTPPAPRAPFKPQPLPQASAPSSKRITTVPVQPVPAPPPPPAAPKAWPLESRSASAPAAAAPQLKPVAAQPLQTLPSPTTPRTSGMVRRQSLPYAVTQPTPLVQEPAPLSSNHGFVLPPKQANRDLMTRPY
jgi:hypothetical protein